MSRPRHIGLVCTEFPPGPHGGTGSSYYDLANGLARRGHRVSVLVVGSPGAPAHPTQAPLHEGVHLRFCRGRFPWLRYRGESLARRWAVRRELMRLHRTSPPLDVVEASDYEGWVPPCLPRSVRSVVRIRGANLYFDAVLGRRGDPWVHRLERWALRRADSVAAVSHYAAVTTLRLAGMGSRTATVIPNAVDADRFHPAGSGERVPGRVLFVGTTSPKKGLRELLEAFRRVFATRGDLELVIAGSEASGYPLADLLAPLPDVVRARVRALGRLDRGLLPDLLRSASVCCMPSHLETFGLAGVEAMACGRPVILSQTGPGPELVVDGEEGLLCDPHDPESIARALHRMLSDLEFAEALGAAARRRVLRDFSLPAWIDRNEAFYAGLGPSSA